MKKTAIALFSALSLTTLVYANGLTVESPLSVVQTTNQNLLTLVYSLQPITDTPAPDAQHFTDITPDAWYETAADYVVGKQIMSGVSDTEFAPDSALTRGVVATVITNIEGAEFGETQNKFPDVAYQWYEDSVNWCSAHLIMNGYPDGLFGGNDPINREQLAIILYQYANYTEKTIPDPNLTSLNKYKDQGAISSFARTAMAWCAEQNLFHQEENLRPDDNATRADVAYAVMQLDGLLF